jgi:hypothetical protein
MALVPTVHRLRELGHDTTPCAFDYATFHVVGRVQTNRPHRGKEMKNFGHLFVRLLLAGGLLAFGCGLSGCSSGSQCGSACGNYAQKCGATSSLSGTTQDCIQMCENSLRSNSGSSRAWYKDMLSCVANAKSCIEIDYLCDSGDYSISY